MVEEDKFIMIGLGDERSKKIAEVIGNKTCKKIIDYLSEVKEASEKDIADKLSIPINTAEYNLNKLIESGLIEKTKNFFWSVKGRKIDMYRLSNKRIIISPKSSFKGVLPAFIAVLALSFTIKVITDKLSYASYAGQELFVNGEVRNIAADTGAGALKTASENVQNIPSFAPSIQNLCLNSSIGSEAWAWFLFGGLITILIFLLINQYQKMKGGLK